LKNKPNPAGTDEPSFVPAFFAFPPIFSARLLKFRGYCKTLTKIQPELVDFSSACPYILF
jgi:hypothetical protein